MNKKTFFSLIAAGMTYFITVIINLILQRPLNIVFKQGIIVLLAVFIFIRFSLFLIDYLNQNYNFKQKNKEKISETVEKNNSNQEAEEVENIDQENQDINFSPLNPPHLEVEEEE